MKTVRALHPPAVHSASKGIKWLIDLRKAKQAGTAARTVQDPKKVTYLGKLAREDGLVDWSVPAPQLERLVRAYHPWPGTYTTLAGRRLKVFPTTAATTTAHDATPGTVLEASGDNLTVACGAGTTLALHTVQPDGKKPMPVSAFLAGHPLAPDTVLGH